MLEIKGQYNTAICYTDYVDEFAKQQLRDLCERTDFAGNKIRIMPDVHAGKGCVIGTTMTITDKVVPAMVGVDIGCGMETVRIEEKQLDLNALDELILKSIPCGREVRETLHPLNEEIDLNELCCASEVRLPRAKLSLGTLGGGNHFIEVDRGADGALYIVIHSGSRSLGLRACKFYEEQAKMARHGASNFQISEMISKLKAEGRFQEIQPTLTRLKAAAKQALNDELTYVEGKLFEDYMHDMKIIQQFALLNRKAMMDEILRGLNLTKADEFTTIHNYIDTDCMVLRKGAVSAQKGERLLIPINMRDGSFICRGKGNAEWNYSAPHGAGRAMSRKQAFASLSMEEYRVEMEGIYSTCVIPETLDESPMAYKGMQEIVDNIGPTAEVREHIRPIYNFKASE